MLFSGLNSPLCKVFNNEDSILLGQKLEDGWSNDADPSVSKSEVWKIFGKELQEVSDRSTIMDIDDWALDNGRRFKKEDLIYTLDPSEDVYESNWREKGYFRKYDARDELHRSPEKLKMIERMKQFPHEDWGQKKGFSEDVMRIPSLTRTLPKLQPLRTLLYFCNQRLVTENCRLQDRGKRGNRSKAI